MKKMILLSALCGMNMWVSYASEGIGAFNLSGIIRSLVIIALIVMILFELVTKITGKAEKIQENVESEFALEIKDVIPDFEEEDFLAWVTERFVKFQKSWSRGAIEEIHPFETESLFEIHRMQLEELKYKNVSNVIEGISVKETDIVSFSDKKEVYEIVVHVRANMRNYFVNHNVSNEADSMVVSESFNYYLTFEKQKQNKRLTVCPACTAPVLPNLGHCEYCHTVFPEAIDQWLLAKIDVV